MAFLLSDWPQKLARSARIGGVAACVAMATIDTAPATTILTDYPHETEFRRDDATGRTLPWSIILPPSHGQDVEPLPLVVYLHASGERGRDGRQQVSFHTPDIAAATQRRNAERLGCDSAPAVGGDSAGCLAIAAEMDVAYESYFMAPQVQQGRRWEDYLDMTVELIEDIVADYNVDPSRIYLTGFSMGGFGTFSMLERYPDLFAAAAPLAGGGDPRGVDAYVDVPMWIFHGEVDDVVPVGLSIEIHDALRAAGGDPLLSVMPGVDHNAPAAVYPDTAQAFYPWLFSHSRVPEPNGLLIAAVAAATATGAPRR